MTLFSAIDRYLAKLIFLPLIGSLVIAALLLVLDRMLRLFDFVASEGGPVSVVWRMLANLLPEYMALGIPIGLLLGILLAFRRIAMSSELDTMQAAGLGYARLLRVPYMYAVALALVNLSIVGFLQPYARYAYEGLRFELRSGALGASIKVGEFNRLGKDMTLRIDSSADEGRMLSGIFVMAKASDGKRLAVAAEHGQFLSTDDPDVIILRLRSGTLVHDAPDYPAPRVLTFASHDLPIDLPKIEQFRRRIANREQTIPELVRIAADPTSSALLKAESWSQFNFRMVQVIMMMMMPMLGVALAVPPKRSTSSLGVFVSIVMVVTYYKVSEYAAGVSALGLVNPFLALWGPFALFAALIGWMFYIVAFVPGGQPIGALERWAGKGIAALGRVFKRRSDASA